MRRGRMLLAAAGLGLLGWLVMRIGPGTLAAQLAGLGRALPLLLVLLALRLTVRTLNWHAALKAEGFDASPLRLVGARLASEGMGYLSILGPLVSEPMKPLLLGRRDKVEERFSATLVESTFYYLSTVVLVLAGAVAGLSLALDPSAAMALLGVSVVVFASVLLLLLGREPLTPRLIPRLPRRVRARQSVLSRLEKAVAVERQIRSFRHRHPRTAARIFLFDFLAQGLAVLEIAVVLWSLGLDVRWAALVAVESAIRMVKLASFFIPGRLGADEGGASAAFLLFGLSPAAGFTLAIARRIEALAWSGAGMIWLATMRSREQRKEPINASGDFVAPYP